MQILVEEFFDGLKDIQMKLPVFRVEFHREVASLWLMGLLLVSQPSGISQEGVLGLRFASPLLQGKVYTEPTLSLCIMDCFLNLHQQGWCWDECILQGP